MKINMIGGGFQHVDCSSANNFNKYIEWKKDGSANVSMHIDWSILEGFGDKSKKKYAWLAESSAIIEKLIEKVKTSIDDINEEYELIFTHDKRLLNLSPKMRFAIPNACPWVKDIGIHKKNNMLSMIGSHKNMCSGHRYRLGWIEKLKNQIPIYGWGHNQIMTKDIGFKDFYFSICMENDNYPSIFTEKITDAFAMGTIPIFWGTPDIGNYFNENGIIKLTDDFNISDLSVDLYHSKMDAILQNYELSVNLPTAEDYIYLNYLK
jgi:hypothetical protein